ncbi:MAG: TetR/AcrR family transcriptional regulator [Candidatus Thorarchaeota archaeon]
MSPRGKALNEEMRAKALKKITNAALKVFADYGYNGATMKEIAQVAGLSYGLVYHYFPSKENIFRHLVDIALKKSIETIKDGLAVNGTAWEKLKNLSTYLVQQVLLHESSQYFLIMVQALTQGKKIAGLMEHIGDYSQLHYNTLIPVIIQAQESGDVITGDPVALTATYLSFVQGLSFLVFGESGMEEKITPEILINALRNK